MLPAESILCVRHGCHSNKLPDRNAQLFVGFEASPKYCWTHAVANGKVVKIVIWNLAIENIVHSQVCHLAEFTLQSSMRVPLCMYVRKMKLS